MVAVGKERNRPIRNYDEHDLVVNSLFGGGGKREGEFKDDIEFLDIELDGPSQNKGTNKQDPIFNCFFATPRIKNF